jgi:signal transduction histidine kinase
LYVERDRLCLVVRDDGDGLDLEHHSGFSTPAGHLGLRALADAAQELHGVLELSTAPAHGTELRWEIPL